MKLKNKLRFLSLVNHLLFFFILYLSFVGGDFSWLLFGIPSAMIVVILGFNIGLHRYFSHRSFQTSRTWQNILACVSVFCGVGSVASWCSIHRLHHVTSDRIGDPHNPTDHGIINTWFNLWKTDPKVKRSYYRNLINTPVLKFTHKHYFSIHLVTILTLFYISPYLLMGLYLFPFMCSFHGSASIAVIAHRFGYRTYNTQDKSKNSWVACIMSMGEGWHNNHHANAGNWRSGEKWWELDPPAWVIKNFIMNKPK